MLAGLATFFVVVLWSSAIIAGAQDIGVYASIGEEMRQIVIGAKSTVTQGYYPPLASMLFLLLQANPFHLPFATAWVLLLFLMVAATVYCLHLVGDGEGAVAFPFLLALAALLLGADVVLAREAVVVLLPLVLSARAWARKRYDWSMASFAVAASLAPAAFLLVPMAALLLPRTDRWRAVRAFLLSLGICLIIPWVLLGSQGMGKIVVSLLHVPPVLSSFGPTDVGGSWLTGVRVASIVILVIIGAMSVFPVASLSRRVRVPPRICVLGMICIAGLLLRLSLAPLPGNGGDMQIEKGWAHSAVGLGIVPSYGRQLDGVMLPNYPPLSMEIFAFTGHAYRLLVSPTYRMDLPAYHVFIKLPGIIADILTSILLYILLRRTRGASTALIGAFIYTVHPAVLYDSAVWGQTDAVYTLFVVGCLVAITSERILLAGALLAAALLTKTQGIFLLPLVAVLLLFHPRWVTRFFAAATVTASVIVSPFWLAGAGGIVLRVYRDSVGYYTAVTMNAYNLWWAFFPGSAGHSDLDRLADILPYRWIGYCLFAISAIVVLLLLQPSVWRKVTDPKRSFLLFPIAALLAYAFFLFLTEMHERYLFPAMALGLPLLFTGIVGAALYTLVSIGYLLNLLGTVSFEAWDRALFAALPSLARIVAVVHIIVFVLCVLEVGRLSGRFSLESALSCLRWLSRRLVPAPLSSRPKNVRADAPAAAKRPRRDRYVRTNAV